jgi:alpha-D-xyloside xylohydrolase
VLDLAHRNCEVSIQFVLSSLGYGFLWHHPGTDRVEFGRAATRWVSEASASIDHGITPSSSPAEVLPPRAPSDF